MAVYRVTLEGREYQVRIENLDTQPVQVEVDGREMQVWLPDRPPTSAPEAIEVAVPRQQVVPEPTVDSPAVPTVHAGAVTEDRLRAPMPGSIISVGIEPGERVEVGQELCVLDAMKMHNLIRAPRAGIISQIHVSPGQQVQHGDLLMTYANGT